jgi:hypothetical protein
MNCQSKYNNYPHNSLFECRRDRQVQSHQFPLPLSFVDIIQNPLITSFSSPVISSDYLFSGTKKEESWIQTLMSWTQGLLWRLPKKKERHVSQHNDLYVGHYLPSPILNALLFFLSWFILNPFLSDRPIAPSFMNTSRRQISAYEAITQISCVQNAPSLPNKGRDSTCLTLRIIRDVFAH